MRELTNSFHAAQQQLLGTFTRAVAKAISAECRLRSALQRITNRVAEELLSLPRTSGSIALLKPAEPNAVLVFLHNLREGKDSRIGAFEALYDLSRRLGLEIRLDDNHWQFFKDEKLVACTGGAKNRLDVLVPINPDDSTRLRPALEKIKNDQIVIDGTIVERMVARLEQRLAREPLAE